MTHIRVFLLILFVAVAPTTETWAADIPSCNANGITVHLPVTLDPTAADPYPADTGKGLDAMSQASKSQGISAGQKWPSKGWRWLYVSNLDLSDPDDLKDLFSLAASSKRDALKWYTSSGPEAANVTDSNQAPCNATGLPVSPKAESSGKAIGTPDHVVSQVTVNIPTLQEYTDRREFLTKGEVVAVAYIFIDDSGDGTCSSDARVTFKETARKLVVDKQLDQYLSSIGGPQPFSVMVGGQVKKASYPALLCMDVQTYTLDQDRATLALALTKNPDDPSQTGSVSITTGGQEHSFFSIDALYMGTADVTYDSTTGTLKGKQAPNRPIVAYNWMLGDPYKNYDGATWRRIVFKFGAQTGSMKDEYGPGIGYLFKTSTFDTNDTAGSFMVFVSYMRTISNTGQRTYSWRWGLSYNLGAFGTKGGDSSSAASN